jgi:hypothetical protein
VYFVAVLPGDLVGQRLRSEEEDFLLPGKIRHRETYVREERAGDQSDAFARYQFFGSPHGFARVGSIVTRDQFEFLAQHAALTVDFFNREIHALFVRIEECGLRLVAVELADLDGVLRQDL